MYTLFENPQYPFIQLFMYFVQFFTIGVTATFTLKLKYNKIASFLTIPVFWYIGLIPVHFSNSMSIATTTILLSVFIWIMIMCKSRAIPRIINALIIIIIVFIIADLGASCVVYFSVGTQYLIPAYLPVALLYVLFSCIFCAVYALIYNKATNENSIKTRKVNNLMPLLVLVFIEFVFIFTIEFLTHLFSDIPSERLLMVLQTLLYIFGVAFIISDIIVYRSAKSNARLQQLQADYKILEYQNNLQTEYYEKMQKNIDSTSKIRHDINNLVQVINIQLEENTAESRAKASEIANEIRNVMLTTRTQKYCDNRLVNTILFDKTALAAESGIKISDEIILDERTGIDNFDLCRIFVNLLDNAINALKKYDGTSNKTVFISCKQSDGFLYIKSENPYTQNFEKKAEKDKDKLHGYGLKIVDDIVKKYNGTLTKTLITAVFLFLPH